MHIKKPCYLQNLSIIWHLKLKVYVQWYYAILHVFYIKNINKKRADNESMGHGSMGQWVTSLDGSIGHGSIPLTD